ncbi:MAG: radical SAM protein [Candidatus Omnitrophica bacterium]|nr:radical SAM protein [Candidatus Omnitrophota bacterium]
MKIAFVNPHEEPYVNIGLAYVISAVEKEHSVKLLDMAFHTRDYASYVLESLKRFQPDVIGFSVTSFSFHHALRIAAVIRKAFPRIPLVYGGVHPTLLPEETLQNPLVDAVCIGEGEDTFQEYLQKLEASREPAGVAGIWYKDKNNAIVKNPLRPFRQDLDSLAFPNWDHWEIERYLQANESFAGGLRHLASRGCPYSCSFCSNPALRRAVPGTFYRTRSPENVIAEIKHNRDKYAGRGFRNVSFGDATFGLDAGETEKLCSLYIREGLHREFPWDCQTRVELVTEAWAEQVSRAGCCMVTLGVESGDEHIRREIYRKDFSQEQIHSATGSLKKYGIAYCMSIIVGCPYDSAGSIRNTLRFLQKEKPLKAHITFYQHLPYTEISNRLHYHQTEGEGVVFKAWNTPRAGTMYLGRWRLKSFMLRFFVRRIAMLFYHGFRLRGPAFLWDTVKYLFAIGQSRTVALNNYCVLMGLEQYTLYSYALAHNRARHKKEATA